MRRIYVIVHEQCIDEHISKQEDRRTLAAALKVQRALLRVKKRYEYVAVHGKSSDIPEQLPKPSAKLEVLVAGAYTGICVEIQRRALDEAKYNVRKYEPGCLSEYA